MGKRRSNRRILKTKEVRRKEEQIYREKEKIYKKRKI